MERKKQKPAFLATPAKMPPGWFTIRAKVPVLVPSTTCLNIEIITDYQQISKDESCQILKGFVEKI